MAQIWQVTDQESLELTEVISSVSVGLVAGSVVITQSATSSSQVEVTQAQGRPVEISLKDGQLSVRHAHVRWEGLLDTLKVLARRDDQAEIRLCLPAGCTVRVSTVTAPIELELATTSISARSVSGAIAVVVSQTPAKVALKSVSGPLRVELPASAGYQLDARSVSGNLQVDGRLIGARPGPPQGELRSGDESVRISAVSVSGAIELGRTAQ